MVILFFIWGFITLLNDLLIPVLRSKLHLSYAEAMLVQFAFFFTYFIMSMPMAMLLNRLNYKKSIIVGLAIIAIGCLIFIPADLSLIYGIFLLGLFVLATGIVMLQVSANPLVTLLGHNATGSARLSFAQGANSLGCVLAPVIVGGFIISDNVMVPYIVIAIIMLLVAMFIGRFNFHAVDDQLTTEKVTADDKDFSLWEHTPFVFGLVGVFVYVGAEVTAGSLIVNFLHLPQIVNFSLMEGAKYLSVYWGGAMIGRLIGSYLLKKIHPPKVLMFNAVANVGLFLSIP